MYFFHFIRKLKNFSKFFLKVCIFQYPMNSVSHLCNFFHQIRNNSLQRRHISKMTVLDILHSFGKYILGNFLKMKMMKTKTIKKNVTKNKQGKEQARKGFRPLSAMQGIGYFQNLWNYFEKLSGGIFLEEFFGELFWEDFFWRNFYGEIFWQKSLGRILCLLVKVS